MVLMSWIRGKDEEIEFINYENEPKWINVFLTINFGKMPKKKVAEIGMEILEIFINAKAVYNSKGEYLGYINPKLNQNTLLTNNKITKEMSYKTISQPFAPEIKQENGDTKLIFFHYKKYSLPELYKDLFILWNICENILELYIKEGDKGTTPSFNPIFIDKKPAIENLEKLLKFRYKVEDRLKYGEERNKKIDKLCLGSNIKEYFDTIKKNELLDRNVKIDKKKSEEIRRWLKEVEKLLKN
jgi:hypothetical protein